MIKVCTCGHLKMSHKSGGVYNNFVPWCVACVDWGNVSSNRFIHKFKLDNLDYVERLAVKKGLI